MNVVENCDFVDMNTVRYVDMDTDEDHHQIFKTNFVAI